jgi:hypothetical protein
MIIAGTGSAIARQDSAVGERSTGSDRITVALVEKAANDLQRLQARTGLSQTDIVNRALSLYEFIDGQLHEGGEVLIRNNSTGEDRLLRLL